MPLSAFASVAEDSAVPPGVGRGLPTAAAAGLGRSEGVPAPPPCGGGEMSSADIPLSARALNPGISKSSSRRVSLSSPRSRGAAGPMLLPYPPCRSRNQNLKNHSLSFLLFSSPSCLIFFLQHVSATAPAQSVCLTSSDHPLPNTPCIRTYRVPCLPRLLAY